MLFSLIQNMEAYGVAAVIMGKIMGLGGEEVLYKFYEDHLSWTTTCKIYELAAIAKDIIQNEY